MPVAGNRGQLNLEGGWPSPAPGPKARPARLRAELRYVDAAGRSCIEVQGRAGRVTTLATAETARIGPAPGALAGRGRLGHGKVRSRTRGARRCGGCRGPRTRSAGVPSKTIRAAVVASDGAEVVDDPVGVGHDRWWCSMTTTELPESTRRFREDEQPCSSRPGCSRQWLVEDVDADLPAIAGWPA